jgi:hypothetical protein
MSVPTALLADLSRRGVHVAVVGERLSIRGPAEALTQAVKAEVAACKAELLSVLRTPDTGVQHVTEISETDASDLIHGVSMISKTPFVVSGAEKPSSPGPIHEPVDRFYSRIQRADDWSELYVILTDADFAYVNGEITGDDVDCLCEMARHASRHLPDRASPT